MTCHQKHDYTNLVQRGRGRIHRSAYTDPNVFADEMIRVFGGTWTYLGHESELPEPYTRRFVRSYHGWTYLSDGRLVAVPFGSSCGPEFDQTELGLGRISRIGTHRGFSQTLSPRTSVP